MEQNRNMEQGGTAAAVPTEKKNENRKREVSGKDAQIIRAFLESVGIYEADALRVSIAIADGKVSADNISADDRLALNRYLNSSTDNDRLTADNVQGHRLNRAFGLLERVSEFCDKQQLVTVNRALLSIAVNAEDINRAVSSLDKRPASVQPTQANTGNNGAGKQPYAKGGKAFDLRSYNLFFFPSFKIGTIQSIARAAVALFHLTHDYGKMKPCRVQQKDKLVFPYRFLHGFILFQKQKYHTYKDKVL
ncbi:hypothetical protein [uncultured Bacteroides sp.]|uniref:hypothetical protein n=1 Tax=uncultured Bacteroides sp. TaxID=162156 RepID=UPI0025953895|nr:hypothetical protein [uncultured Bacteroides sp.]